MIYPDMIDGHRCCPNGCLLLLPSGQTGPWLSRCRSPPLPQQPGLSKHLPCHPGEDGHLPRRPRHQTAGSPPPKRWQWYRGSGSCHPTPVASQRPPQRLSDGLVLKWRKSLDSGGGSSNNKELVLNLLASESETKGRRCNCIRQTGRALNERRAGGAARQHHIVASASLV